MEKIAIISDIHGNITALKEVLKDIKERQITRIICLGDTVLKNSEPKECLKLVREKCEVILKGNTDNCTVFPHINKPEHEWNHKQLTKEEIKFLNNLPNSYEFYFSGHLIRCFHSSPFHLNDIVHIPDSLNASIPREAMFENTTFIGKTKNDPTPDIVIYGHTHASGLGRLGNKQLINVGSVGSPVQNSDDDENDPKNQLTTMANYCILEGTDGKKLAPISVTFIKIPYQIAEEINNLKNSHMPNKDIAIKELQTGIYTRR